MAVGASIVRYSSRIVPLRLAGLAFMQEYLCSAAGSKGLADQKRNVLIQYNPWNVLILDAAPVVLGLREW